MMGSTVGVPSMATLFSAYAAITAFMALLQQAFNQFVPQRIQEYLYEMLAQWFNRSKVSPNSAFTLCIRDQCISQWGEHGSHNQVFDACEKYVCSKFSNFTNRLEVSREEVEGSLNFSLLEGQDFQEVFEGVEFTWHYVISPGETSGGRNNVRRHFELSVEKKHRNKAVNSYLPFVLSFYDELQKKEKALKLRTLDEYRDHWHAVEFKHSFTFDSLAMDPVIKKSITDDLDRFVKRKEFYRRVGKAWKRGYLLYGPPGTGKSSLIAAMANHLKFDIYDLQLSRVTNDTALRRLLLRTTNKSIVAIEDIDCSLGLPRRREDSQGCIDDNDDQHGGKHQISLSGLLNFLDGLWSCCGDERIIIITTNHKDKLEPALLRPGRMDMHIHMSYLTMPGFRVLAANYLDIANDEHPLLFKELESLIGTVNVTAAEVAELMLRSKDAETTLQEIIELLKKGEIKSNEDKNG